MKTSNWMKRFAAIGGSALMGLMFATGANAAAPVTVPVEVTWVAPIVVGVDNPLQFGLLAVAMADTETVTIATDGLYSESTAGTVVGGTQAQAQLTITVADATDISILVDSIGPGTYYALDNFFCSYELAADVACESAYDVTSSGSSSTGDTLEIGARLTKNSTPATAVADDTTFDATVIFK